MRHIQRSRLRTSPRVDWPQVLDDLYRRGMTRMGVAQALDLPRTTVYGWADLDVEPCHADGERLIVLWIRQTGMQREQLPLANAFGGCRDCREPDTRAGA